MLGGLLTFSEKMTKLITFEDIFQATIFGNKSSVIFDLKKFDILHQSLKQIPSSIFTKILNIQIKNSSIIFFQ
jgi:hypothetical protein